MRQEESLPGVDLVHLKAKVSALEAELIKINGGRLPEKPRSLEEQIRELFEQ